MSFLESYLKKHRLDKIPDKHKKNLKKLEDKLNDQLQGSSTFEDCLKDYGPEISDLVERASNALKDLSFSFQKLRVVINIGIEVYQVVEQMDDCVLVDGMTEEEKKAARIEFGRDLTYFIWMTVDPLADYLTWLPFKKKLEKLIVRWLAGYAMEAAIDMFTAQSQVNTMSAEAPLILRMLP